MNKQEVSPETHLWLMSLACAQIILENQDALEKSNKYRQQLKQATQRFIDQINKSMIPDINAIFNEDEETCQLIMHASEELTKLAASLDITQIDKVINFIKENNLSLND